MIWPHKYFSEEEVRCRCDDCELAEIPTVDLIHPALLTTLGMVRRRCYRHPITATSFIRCRQHNEDKGGKEKSSHLADPKIGKICTAGDLIVPGAAARYELVTGFQIEAPVTCTIQIGVYQAFTHIGVNPAKQNTIFYGSK